MGGHEKEGPLGSGDRNDLTLLIQRSRRLKLILGGSEAELRDPTGIRRIVRDQVKSDNF